MCTGTTMRGKKDSKRREEHGWVGVPVLLVTNRMKKLRADWTRACIEQNCRLCLIMDDGRWWRRRSRKKRNNSVCVCCSTNPQCLNEMIIRKRCILANNHHKTRQLDRSKNWQIQWYTRAIHYGLSNRIKLNSATCYHSFEIACNEFFLPHSFSFSSTSFDALRPNWLRSIGLTCSNEKLKAY